MGFKRTSKSGPEDRPKIASTAPADSSSTEREIETSLIAVGDTLLRDGPAAALGELRNSTYFLSEPATRLMHAVVWNHQDKLSEEFLQQSFLDRVWCQCTACDHTWLISPLLGSEPGLLGETSPDAGFVCASCACVLCPLCARETTATCSCGATFTGIRRPNGRTSRKHAAVVEEKPNLDRFYDRDQPPEGTGDLHLYFGFEGKVPIGTDPSFPIMKPIAVDAHVGWADVLLGAGLYYQAQQQIDILTASGISTPLSKWVSAELKLIQLNNGKERLRRRTDYYSSRSARAHWPDEIKGWLEAAIEEDPGLGPAWLTLSQISLDLDFGFDSARALECARQARALLGDTPGILLSLGKALRETGVPAESVAVLSLIPANSAEHVTALRELKLAQWEKRCQDHPVDLDAHLRLGTWWLKHGVRPKAEKIFNTLYGRRPDSAEAVFGRAWLALTDEKPYETRLNEAHRLCLEALNYNAAFGLAYELLGTIFQHLKGGRQKVNFDAEDPIEYYQRALKYDYTCDIALRSIAEHHIDQGQLGPAKELLERAKALDTNDATTYNILAVIYQGLREYDKEDEASRKGRELWPEVELNASYKDRILQLCGFEY
jgi:tetratricopeptide (TPR) repeat protein